MSTVKLDKRSLEDYDSIVGKEQLDQVRTLADGLAETSVVNVNSTSFGGGVAEILNRLVPLMRDLRLKVDWKVIQGQTEFYRVTKEFHNALQGKELELTESMKKLYIKYNKLNARTLELDHDYIVIHDPQPLAMRKYSDPKRGKWIWRCHIDLSKPNSRFWSFLKPFFEGYSAFVFSMKKYVKSALKRRLVSIIPPSIDPLSDKNRPLKQDMILSVLDRYDVDPARPILTQVGRFDPWKDPLGVIDVYKQIKTKVPTVQLLLITSMAHDDPEGWTYYEKTARKAGEDYDIHLLTDLVGVKDLEVNAFQRATNVALLKSIREGFGLTVAEALWKEVPVVGGDVGGIRLQVIDCETGYLVRNVGEAVKATLHLLKHPEKAKMMGRRGKQHVKENFLITTHLKKYLQLFSLLENTHRIAKD